MTASVILQKQADFDEWRGFARSLIADNIPPGEVVWSVGVADDLFAEPYQPTLASPALSISKQFMPLAESVIQHRSPTRFALLYKILWRMAKGERHLPQIASDVDISAAMALSKAVRRDRHKMRAFLRFRKVHDEGKEYYVAWFEPDHYILDSNARFFIRRFATMEWVILTPDRCAHWDGQTLSLGLGTQKELVPQDDAMADYWQCYFNNIFNPARLMVKAMTTEMPKKYWKNMPEASSIPALISTARARTAVMIENGKGLN